MKKTALLVVCMLAIVVAFGSMSAVNGQALTGTFTGIVMDKSQAVVPDANVTLKDERTGAERKTVTNPEGFFAFFSVLPSTYTVTVEKTGFSKWERTGNVMNPGDRRNVADIVLQVAAAAEAVTVTAAVETLATTDSPEKSTVVSQKELQNLTLVSRSAAELIKALPGMVPYGAGVENRPAWDGQAIGINGNGTGGQQSPVGYYSPNGQLGNTLDISLDSTEVTDPGCNCAIPVNPNVDMIEEFKVQTSNYSAENARGPVVLNSVSKSGGRDFHGTAYFYLRDYRMNANQWQFNGLKKTWEIQNGRSDDCSQPIPAAPGCRPKDKYRFPGGNFGGPVLFPHSNFNRNRDKMFFFVGYEYYDQTVTSSIIRATVPTADMLKGDFSKAGQFAPRNTRFLPTDNPNCAVCGGIVGGVIPPSMLDPGGVALAKTVAPPIAGIDPTTSGGYNRIESPSFGQPMHQLLARVDYNITENTRLFVRHNLQKETQNFPYTMWWANGDGVPYPSPVVGNNISQALTASITHVFSPTMTNEVVFGLTFVNFPNSFSDPSKVDRATVGYPYGSIYAKFPAPTPGDSGRSLIGRKRIPNISIDSGFSMYMEGGFNPVFFAKKYEGSIQDNLSKVIGTHTLKFGFYWEEITNNQPYGSCDQGCLGYSNTAPGSSGNSLADLMLGITNSYSENNIDNLLNQGWRKTEFYAQDSWKTTPRLTLEYGARFSRLGSHYDRQGIGYGAWFPETYSNDPSKVNDLTGIKWHLRNPEVPLSGRPTHALFFAPRLGVAYDLFGSGKTVIRGGFGMYRWPWWQDGNGLSVGVGLLATSTPAGTLLKDVQNYNPPGGKTGVGVQDGTDDQQPLTYNWNFTIDQRLPGAILWELSYVGNATRYLNGGLTPQPNLIRAGTITDRTADPNLYRPLQNYSSVYVSAFQGYSNYNGFQMTVKRQTGRINWSANYTFSKGMGLCQDGVCNPEANDAYGPLNYDQTHAFNIAYNILLPDFAKQYMNTNNKAARGILDGWQISGISQITSSARLDQYMGTSSFITLPNGNSVGASAIDITGSPDYSVRAFWTCDPRSGVSGSQYINPSCFAPPSPGHNGPYVPPFYMKGPMYYNNDMSLTKNWQFTEHKKLQFRLSATNFLNHPLWSFFNGDSNLALNFDANGKITNPNFGIPQTKLGRRIVMLGFKFFF